MRTPAAELERDALSALDHAAGSAGLGDISATDGAPDAVLWLEDGRSLSIEIEALSHAAPPTIRRLLGRPDTGADLRILVGDDIPEASKDMLREAGWGWFDRRGHLFLRAPGLLVNDTTLDPLPRLRTSVETDPIRGASGLATAVHLLLDPSDPPGVREIARESDMAPSTISSALARLREASLVAADGRPLVPELFWALADAWKPARRPLQELPDPDNAAAARPLELGVDPDAARGWVLAGTLGAIGWGAPVVVTADFPPDVYAPSADAVRRAVHRLGTTRWERRACALAQAPVPVMARKRFSLPDTSRASPWPLAHPLFVALDLAQDAARGVEVLDEWTPPEPFIRVW